MPTYDYQCTRCDALFQAFHGMGALPPHCPECGGPPMQVFLKAPAVHGDMARGRELAVRSLQHDQGAGNKSGHGPGCACCGGGHPQPSSQRTPSQ